MRYPKLEEIPTSRDWIDVFLGYNHNERIGSGEFYDMTNLTSDEYPVLCPRKKRGVFKAEANNITGLVSKDSLCYVEGDKFVMSDYTFKDLGLTTDLDAGSGIPKPKQLISMGSYVIILPDKKYVNVKDFTYGDIEASLVTEQTVNYKMCKLNGETGDAQKTAPEDKSKLWIDTSVIPNALKQYSTNDEEWVSIATTYTKIEFTGGDKPEKFNAGDGITIRGSNKDALNGSFVIETKGDNFIVVKAMIEEVGSQESGLTIKRSMPDMDFVIESNNRLWGCKYGLVTDADGKEVVVNEIYASKLGDFKNWYAYAGTAADSYAVTVGTDGDFTGAISYLGYPVFFKEGCMHKIYGNYPSNYQVQTTTCRGVQRGCSKSLDIVNEVLYYKSKSGIMAYSGSLPVEVSAVLGDIQYSNAVAGHLGNKYYIYLKDNVGGDNLFVYDTKKVVWHREDAIEVSEFCNHEGELYFINRGENQIQTVTGTGTLDTNAVNWEAVTGYIGTDTPDKKYISKLDVRMQLASESTVTFYAEYDSSGEFEYLFAMTGKNLQSFSVPVRPKRCDHLRLKIIGEGEAKIFSICKTLEWGSSR